MTRACLEEWFRGVSCDRWPVPACGHADLPRVWPPPPHPPTLGLPWSPALMASVGQALDFFLKLSTALLLAASGAMSLSVSYNKMANRLPSKGVCGRQASALCCGACSHSFLTETAGGALPAHLTVEDIEATCAGPPPRPSICQNRNPGHPQECCLKKPAWVGLLASWSRLER